MMAVFDIASAKAEKRCSRLLLLIFCCAVITEWFQVTFYGTHFAYSTYCSLAFVVIGLVAVIRLRVLTPEIRYDYQWLLYLLLFWNIITIIRGFLDAKTYWDWKILLFSNLPALLIPLSSLFGGNISAVGNLFKTLFPIYFILAFLSVLPINPPLIIYLGTPIYFYILCLPYFDKKKRIWILIFTAVLFTIDLSARSNLLRICMALGICVSWRFIQSHVNLMLKVQKFLFIAPLILIILGVTGTFNIFDLQSYLGDEMMVTGASGTEENLMSDTRSFIYREQFESMQIHNSFLFGEGACGKYITHYFVSKEFGTFRTASEVGALNTLLYSGIIGLALYGMVFFFASKLAIGNSENTFCKLMGLFIIFRWDYFFVEEFTKFNTNFFILWLMIGMCLSPNFRAMSDDDIYDWLHGENNNF